MAGPLVVFFDGERRLMASAYGRRVLWRLTLYPEAGEAGGSVCVEGGLAREPGESSSDPERSAHEAIRRARGQIRRYCAANLLNRLGTLTYAGEGCHDPAALRKQVGAFFRLLRTSLGGESFPYLWVPQWHPGGHGLHAHFAVGRFISRSLIVAAWGRGFVHIKLLGDLPVGSGALEEARLAARYISPYVSRSLDEARQPGLHRYEVAEGFQPQPVECYGPTLEAALGSASKVMGGPPARVWRSSRGEGWNGPPACWAQWRCSCICAKAARERDEGRTTNDQRRKGAVVDFGRWSFVLRHRE